MCKDVLVLSARANTRTPGEIGLRTCEQLVQCFGATFDKFDEDTSGTMNSYELRLALNAAGFHLNNQLTQALTSRYRDSRLRVDFERFVSCAARLTCIFLVGGGYLLLGQKLREVTLLQA
ncbi:hypothetical protein A6R68_08605 [Neotoma lepida]|uniref:EF-hand domain-containing protein n=1 Tax=Neotoma lepida TaxID=56216 RepID=A0A1A6G3B2_NEOLE|nr:hypothetical protein A6R68_08605 [Neotoma lepida]